MRVEWAGEMFRMVAGTLERPTSDIETLRRLSAIIDPVLHEHTDYGLTDIVELILRRVDTVASALAPKWPAGIEQVLQSTPSLCDDELVAAASLPSLEDQIAQCSNPERARAALEAHSVPAKNLRRDEMSMIATFGATIAIRHGQRAFIPLPTGLIVEAFNALAGALAAKALALDPSLDYKWLTAAWRYIGSMLDEAGLDVIGPLRDERHPYLHSVIRYSDCQYLAISVVGGLDHSALHEAIGKAASHLETVSASSTLTAVNGTVALPASARLCRLLIVAQPQAAILASPSGAKCALMTHQDLDWIRRTIGRDEIDLWYFVRDRVEQPRIGQLFSWDGIDLWESWRGNGKSFFRGARPLDVLYAEPHHSLAEWQKASEQSDIELSLNALGMGRVSAWPLHSLDGTSILVGNAKRGALYRLVVCETPVAVALRARSGDEQASDLARSLGNCLAYKLECVRAQLVDLMQASGLSALRIEFAITDDNQDLLFQMAEAGSGVLTIGCAPGFRDQLQEDSRAVEAQLGALLSDAISGGLTAGVFVTAWNSTPPGIRVDAITVLPRIQEAPEPSTLHKSHLSAHLAELGAQLDDVGIHPGSYGGDSGKRIETDIVYPWLIDRLHEELSKFDCAAVLDLALTQLECTNSQRWWATTRTAYQTGTPSEGVERLPELGQELLHQSRFISLIIEELLARPPSGTKTPTEYDWQELLSLATLAGESSSRSEALHRELANPTLVITDLFEVIIDEDDISAAVDLESFSRDARLAGLPEPIPIGSPGEDIDPDQEWTPIGVRAPEFAGIDQALQGSLGFSLDAILGILDITIQWPVSTPQCTELVLPQQLAAEVHSANPQIPLADYEAAAECLSFSAEVLASADSAIKHWEVERRSARVAIRPLIGDESGVWVLPWTAELAKKAWVTYLSQLRLPIHDDNLPPPVAKALKTARDARNTEFENDCLEQLANLPLLSIPRVRKRHAHRHGINNLSGEIDILSIDAVRSIIFVIEAKDPFVPLSARTIHTQINQFHKAGGYVDKLNQKVRDVEASAESLAANKGIDSPDREWRVAGIMVTRHVSPAAYHRTCSTTFCTIDDLRETVAGDELRSTGDSAA
ncbi:hypothetical protein [Candidatus Poriferisodalis sp.]|uniref:hypothetical protein n=1 Tax=Candidatus Poriferisodalis sp. TaxID=3101277 RepID=UPI003B01B154